MSIWGESDSKFVKLPKEGGESIIIDIKTIEKVEGEKSKFNFHKKEKVALPDGSMVDVQIDQLYRFRLTMQDGKILEIGSWKPYYAFKNAGVKEGDRVRVSHPVKGEWLCDILKKDGV